jgi:hypothetical protein
MQVASRWAEPVVSDLASVPYDGNHHIYNIEQQQQISIPTNCLSSLQPSLITPSLFPPQRVEPVDMPRLQQQQQKQNRNKTGYIRPATTDEQQGNVPVKRVKHPADQSAIVIFLKRLSKFCFSFFISIPCVILITLILPISWLIRTFIRCTCRYHCTVTPCTCSYLSPNDLFWLYNSNKTINRNKNEETTKLNSRTIAPIAAAIFFLEGNNIRSFFFFLYSSIFSSRNS